MRFIKIMLQQILLFFDTGKVHSRKLWRVITTQVFHIKLLAKIHKDYLHMFCKINRF
jgi:hypothetical protein